MSDFDPNAFLMEGGDFDPDAFVKDAFAKEPKRQPSYGDSALAGVQQLGSFEFGDELGAALQAGLMKLPGDWKERLGGSRFEDKDPVYERARDENRAEVKAAKDAHPGIYYAAGLPAALASSAPLSVARAGQGASLLTRALAGGANGVVQGALAGAGNSTGDSGLDVAKDAAGAGLMGGVVGSTLPVVGDGLSRALSPITKRLGGFLEEKAIDQGRRVLTNGADSLSTRAPVKDEAVVEAIRSGGIRPFGTTQSALGRLQGLTEEQAQKYGNLVSRLEESGVAGPEAETLAQRLLDQGAELEKNVMNEALPEAYLQAANKTLAKAESSGRLGLKQALNLTRDLQKSAKYGRVEDTPLNEVRRDIASTFRRGIEEAVDQQGGKMGSEVGDLAGSFIPTKQRLGRLIEAEAAATRGAARGAQRNAIGLKDIAAATAATASGNVAAAPVAIVGSNLLNNRVPSAVASYGLRAADALRSSQANPDNARRLQALILALRNQDRPVFIDAGSISRGPGGALADKGGP